ncbi:MAG: deaminase [Alphaproteobacteria bacterium]|nr:deaminase [Alphaproteobacteria bacterium]
MAKKSDLTLISPTCRRKIDLLETHRLWLKRAAEIALASPEKGGSPHPSVKVGAILVDAKGLEIAHAANGFAHGIDRRRPERYENGARSLWINCAEQMVIAKAARNQADLKGAKLYVTLEPCAICAGLLVECGICEVIVPLSSRRSYAKLKAKWKKSIEIGSSKLMEAGVKVTVVDVSSTR